MKKRQIKKYIYYYENYEYFILIIFKILNMVYQF
jgi:hypothetical protein